jgi:hypothetical protein
MAEPIVVLDDKVAVLVQGAVIWASAFLPAFLLASRRGVTRAVLAYPAGAALGLVAALACFALLGGTKDTLGHHILNAFGVSLVGLIVGLLSRPKPTRPEPLRPTGPGIRQATSPWTGAPFENSER